MKNLNILDVIVLSSILSEIEEKSNEKYKESGFTNHVEVYVAFNSMSVLFNDVDKDQISEFIDVLDSHHCEYSVDENEFEITSSRSNLYDILLYLTTEYEEITLY